MRNKVVARYLDGRVIKGTTQDFIPSRSFFHVIVSPGTAGVQVRLDELKAVFFVKDLQGNPDRVDVPAFTRGPGENAYGKKIAVRFADGELLCGYSLAYAPGREGFFLAPMNTAGNNERVFVVLSQGVEVLEGQAADELIRRWTGQDAA